VIDARLRKALAKLRQIRIAAIPCEDGVRDMLDVCDPLGAGIVIGRLRALAQCAGTSHRCTGRIASHPVRSTVEHFTGESQLLSQGIQIICAEVKEVLFAGQLCASIYVAVGKRGELLILMSHVLNDP